MGLHVKVGSLSYKLEDYMTSNQNRFNYKKESSSKLVSDVILSGRRNAAGHNTDAYAATNTQSYAELITGTDSLCLGN